MDEHQWLGGSWVLEYVEHEEEYEPQATSSPGLPVRQRWLSRPTSEEEEAQAASWGTGTKIEQLIVS